MRSKAERGAQLWQIEAYNYLSVNHRDRRSHVAELFQFTQRCIICSNIAVHEFDFVLRKKLFHLCAEHSAWLAINDHTLAHPTPLKESRTTRVTSPRQHFPEGFLSSHAQLPAFTSAAIRSGTVDRPVSAISFSISWRVKPKQ